MSPYKLGYSLLIIMKANKILMIDKGELIQNLEYLGISP